MRRAALAGQSLQHYLTAQLARIAATRTLDEVLAALRRQRRQGGLDAGQVAAAVDDLLNLELEVYPTGPLLRRAWNLRENVTAYDACYVALAEALGCSLLTADARLSRADAPTCGIELISA